MAKIIVLMGAPGAGKGTQARLLQERMSLPQISTGDMFRALAATNTPLANEVRIIQQAGRLIPDNVVIRVVEERTSQNDCRNGYILDGFPRTAAQAVTLLDADASIPALSARREVDRAWIQTDDDDGRRDLLLVGPLREGGVEGLLLDVVRPQGMVVLVHQAATQFQLYTGQPAPVDLMREIVSRYLKEKLKEMVVLAK